jgi:signal transduction histidine kinase
MQLRCLPVPYHSIDDPAILKRLLQAVFLLESELALPDLLRHFVEEACDMIGARFGALGVLDEAGTSLVEFVTVGLDRDQERAIGPRPTGKGVLGLLITDPHPLRLAKLSEHPKSHGFPQGHPAMTSFLGVPVMARNQVFGNLYLTDKVGAPEFSQLDEELAIALAFGAGIAIENARLHQHVRDVAVFDDRDRIAKDLHDAVIQRLFAIGLSLQGITRSVTTTSISERLNRAIADIDETIRQIRSSIFELSTEGAPSGARSRVLELVHELDAALGFETHVTFVGPVDTTVPETLLEHVLAVLREALTNVSRHAEAGAARVTLRVQDRVCTLVVSDNGRGMAAAAPARAATEGGLGLANLRRRAEKLGGEMEVTSSPEGTTLEWRVPLSVA